MTHNISQILDIKIPNKISRIICASSNDHIRSTLYSKINIYECGNCGNFACGKCSAIMIFARNNKKILCVMCYFCDGMYSRACWGCGVKIKRSKCYAEIPRIILHKDIIWRYYKIY